MVGVLTELVALLRGLLGLEREFEERRECRRSVGVSPYPGSVEPPKPETLMWAEFLWRVAREAPEVLAAWITIYLFWQQLRGQKNKKGVRHVLDLRDSVMVSDSLVVRPADLGRLEAHGTSSASLKLTTPTQITAR